MQMKLLAIGGAIALLGAGALVVPEYVAGYRLEQAMDQDAQAAREDGGPWPRIAESCFACHGPQGRSSNQGYPALAGQPAAYLAAQLRAFAGGQRPSATMGPLARQLSDGQIQALAAYFAGHAGLRTDPAPTPALDQQGRALSNSLSCQACHGSQLQGKDSAPRLAGQGATYLAAQLTAFKTGQRKDPSGTMNGIAAALTAEDIPVVARHLASLTPTR